MQISTRKCKLALPCFCDVAFVVTIAQCEWALTCMSSYVRNGFVLGDTIDVQTVVPVAATEDQFRIV